MTPFWRNAVPLVISGVILAVTISAANFLLSKATIDPYLRAWTAEHGYNGSTGLALGILLTNLFYYPVILGVTGIILLPVLLAFRPDWARRLPSAAALILLPALVVTALWWAGPSLLLIYTLPATLGALILSASLVALSRYRSSRTPVHRPG